MTRARKDRLDTELAEERHHLAESRTPCAGCASTPKLSTTPATRWPATPTPPSSSAGTWPAASPSWPTTDHAALLRPLELADDERHHIGRRHVTDDAGEPMVLDWRAPLSRAFYRASVRDPQGVATRRRFGFVKGVLTSFEDEHLDRGEELGTKSRILTAEIERPRVGDARHRGDHPARAGRAGPGGHHRLDLRAGAPGTGKTAVGLHRAHTCSTCTGSGCGGRAC